MFRVLSLALILFSCAIQAADAPASKESIHELLEVTNARNLVDGMMGQMRNFMKQGMTQALHGRELDPEEQEFADAMAAKMAGVLKDELSWDKLEPMYLEIYEKTFTQEEIEGMIAFYKTPAGIAVIKKMPAVMQQTMTVMQQRMGPMMEKVKTAIDEAAEDIQKKSYRQKRKTPKSEPDRA